MTSIPLVYSFWFMLAAYVVHIIDECLLGGNFVEKVQQHWGRSIPGASFSGSTPVTHTRVVRSLLHHRSPSRSRF